ncbi:methyl-accepting chemotaxis sensory transducer [Caballeronia sordidicola]|uniref:Methyl-accepting chemotaxis sensory transducer n=1 Tax=Caballeronia sordidicola TaxID=196367 RepID=A0A158FSF8_CABSO|nr:methyl-accepting chemotaxis protein [Caballeronia sordidicola]SAL22758.1 methyl-accepting chemotaxis sensory transducer [Caballeronia sordidicola]
MNILSTIKGRLGIAMAFLGVLLVIIGGLGLWGMNRGNETTRGLFTNEMPSAVAAGNAEMFTARERLSFDRAALLVGKPAAAETAIGRGALMRDRANKEWARYAALPQGPGEHEMAEAFQAKRLELQKMLDDGYANVRANDAEKIVASAEAMQVKFNEMAAIGESLRKYQFDSAKSDFELSQQKFSEFQTISVVAIIIGLIAAAFSWLSLRRAIGRPLDEALAQFDAIASGDLRRELVVTSRDEMGQLLTGLAKMQASLIDTVRTVRSGSESIASATKQIAAGNIDLSSRTEEQASALQQTASSMDELTGTVKQNAENARQASSLAANASEIANKGSTVVSQVVDTMGDINQSSTKIADIITIIEGIAFQTNILALNAAVEAARAGEQGRGFAVVAAEVRSLAQRSSGAAKEIKELINTSVARVQTGTTLVGDAGRTMSEIIGAVQRVTDIMGEIAAASHEQSSGIEQVALAVTQMDEVTQQNAALVEEAAAAAQSLEDQAGALKAAVAVFQLNDGGAEFVKPAAKPARAAALAQTTRAVASERLARLKTPLVGVEKAKPVALAGAADWEAF